MNRYYKLSHYWKDIFHNRVQKIPLDAGFNCPNRDGTLSRRGCIFCNPQGSGSGLMQSQGMSLREQYLLWREKMGAKYKSRFFAGYLQSYSNTYGPVEKLDRTLDELRHLPDLKVLSLGTRPDCLDSQKAGLLASFPAREIWLELGLQSSRDRTLELINRGHSSEDFALACNKAARHGINVCAHVIAGLPGEELQDFLSTIDFINQLPVRGIKIHNLYICSQTILHEWWKQGFYTPLSLEVYAHWSALALARLRRDIVVHRLTGDPWGDELVAPGWCRDKNAVLQKIQTHMQDQELTQGQHCPIPPRY